MVPDLRIQTLLMLGCLLVPRAAPAEVPDGYKGRQPFFFQNTPGSCGPACAKMMIATITGQLAHERDLHRAAGRSAAPPLPPAARHRLYAAGKLPRLHPRTAGPDLSRSRLFRRMAPRRGQTKDPTRGEYGFSGVSISGLIQAMRDHRLDANLLRGVSADQLARWTATAPVIAKVSDGRSWNHVVVVDGVEGDQVKLRDPAAGKLKVPISRFEQVFTGQVVRASARPGVSYPQATSRDAKQKRIVDLLTLVDCGYKQSPSWPAVSGPWNRLRQEGRLDWAVQLAP